MKKEFNLDIAASSPDKSFPGKKKTKKAKVVERCELADSTTKPERNPRKQEDKPCQLDPSQSGLQKKKKKYQ